MAKKKKTARKKACTKKSAKVRETKADMEALEQSRKELQALIDGAKYWIEHGTQQLERVDEKLLALRNTRAEIEYKIEQAPEKLKSLQSQMTQLETRMRRTAARPVVDKLADTMAEVQRLAKEMGVTPERLQEMLAEKAKGGAM